MTVVLQLDPERPDSEAIKRAAAVIRGGGLVAFPTETVYGLGADAMNEQAVCKIFEAKGRPIDNPLIVHVAGRDMFSEVAASDDERIGRLIERFWPGPLTLVVRRNPQIAPQVSAGLDTVAVRMPQNRIALELIREAATPVAAPSANLSGRPSPTRAEHVLADLDGRIDMVLDGGTTNIGIESTVLDMTVDPPAILRPGWVTGEAIAGVVGTSLPATSGEALGRSPGTRHRHYSPRARVILVERRDSRFIHSFCTDLLKSGPVAFLGHTLLSIESPDFTSIILREDAAEYARSIYSALRALDERSPLAIVVEGISESGEGAAVMDRLRRAASEIII
jgi:L-threonylcarbamoyladenylate synthase